MGEDLDASRAERVSDAVPEEGISKLPTSPVMPRSSLVERFICGEV
jgi:hypothetical protein